VIANHHRRGSGEILLLHVRDLFVPTLLTGFCIERHQVIVGRFEEKPIAVHAHAAITNMDTALGAPKVVPNFAARPRIHRPRIIRGREVEIPFTSSGVDLIDGPPKGLAPSPALGGEPSPPMIAPGVSSAN